MGAERVVRGPAPALRARAPGRRVRRARSRMRLVKQGVPQHELTWSPYCDASWARVGTTRVQQGPCKSEHSPRVTGAVAGLLKRVPSVPPWARQTGGA